MDQLQQNKKPNELTKQDEFKGVELKNPDISEEIEEIEEEIDESNGINPELKEYALKMLAGKMAFIKRDETNDQTFERCGCF